MTPRTMTKIPVILLVGVLAAGSGTRVMRADDDPPANVATEVTENPGLLVSPGSKAAELTVYGVKLGDPMEKIPPKAGAAKRSSENNPAITYCVGPDVAYVVFEGKVVEIVVGGVFTAALQPYDMARVQMALGKADQIDPEDETDHLTYLTFLARHMKVNVFETHLLRARITAVTLYAP